MSKLIIKKNNPIDGGEANLVYDPNSEQLHYHGWVKLKIGPFKKKFPFNGNETVTKDLMRSDSLFEGKEIQVKDVKITVVSIHYNFATVSFDSDDFDGVAELDTTGEYLDVITVKAEGKFQGIKLRVEAYRG
jgi:hypothetical protein